MSHAVLDSSMPVDLAIPSLCMQTDDYFRNWNPNKPFDQAKWQLSQILLLKCSDIRNLIPQCTVTFLRVRGHGTETERYGERARSSTSMIHRVYVHISDVGTLPQLSPAFSVVTPGQTRQSPGRMLRTGQGACDAPEIPTRPCEDGDLGEPSAHGKLGPACLGFVITVERFQQPDSLSCHRSARRLFLALPPARKLRYTEQARPLTDYKLTNCKYSEKGKLPCLGPGLLSEPCTKHKVLTGQDGTVNQALCKPPWPRLIRSICSMSVHSQSHGAWYEVYV
ncbi:hypothetical protein LEMLEM_LOCUS8534 [Lemmus lemmus]